MSLQNFIKFQFEVENSNICEGTQIQPERPPWKKNWRRVLRTTFSFLGILRTFSFLWIYIYKYGTLRIGMCLRFWCWEVAWHPRGAARAGCPADEARIQPERRLGMKKNVFPIFFLNDELPVNLSLILRLVVTAMKRNTRSEFYRASFSEFVIFRFHHWKRVDVGFYILP